MINSKNFEATCNEQFVKILRSHGKKFDPDTPLKYPIS